MTCRWTENARDILFFLFLFVLPFQTVYLWREPIIHGAKWQYGTIGIYLSSLVLAAAIMFGAILKVKAMKRESVGIQMKSLWRERKTDAFLLLFVIWSGLSILWAQDTALAGYTFIKILLAADAFIMMRDLVRRGKIQQIVLVLFVAAVIQSLIGVGQFLTQESFSSKLLGMNAYESWQSGTSVLKNDAGRFLRAYGSFPHPNVFGLFLAVVLLIVLKRITAATSTLHFITSLASDVTSRLDSSPRAGEQAIKKVRDGNISIAIGKNSPPPLCEERIEEGCGWYSYFPWVASLFGILVILLGLIISFSRLAWGGFAFGFIFLAWQRYRQFRKSKDQTWRYPLAIFATIVFSIAIFTSILHETILPRFDQSIIGQERSVVDRMSTYRDAIAIIRAHPLLGVGAGNYTAELIRTHPERPIWDIQPAHDVPLLILSELGIPGLVFSLCIFWFLIASMLKTKTTLGKGQTLAFAILLVLIPSLLFDHFLWDSNFGLLFLFALIGLKFDMNQRILKQ
jgi:hypothetical protein